jgi:hypothetical protein
MTGADAGNADGGRDAAPTEPAASPVLLFERLSRAIAPEYEMIRELGGGGMGFVYLALDRALDRVVAIKAIRPELATAAAVNRFLREARVLARIQHPNIVPVHRAGTADGLPYYVMEYVQGETLADRLRRGPLSEREAITIGRALLEALAAAHAAGVVHRDVKPANVFLAEGRVLLGDFGVARVDTTDPDGTSTSGNVGTPTYMAPEQAAGGGATERSDLYAAGMVVYEMLTGRRWIPVADPVLAEWSAVPRRHRAPLRRALAWDPAHRWDGVTAFRRVLSPRYPMVRRVTISGWLVALAAVVAAVAYFAWTQRGPLRPGIRDFAIVPFDAGPGTAPEAGEDMANLVAWQLDIPQLRMTPFPTAARWWNAASDAERAPDNTSLCRRLRARRCARGWLRRTAAGVEWRMSLLNEDGRVADALPDQQSAGEDALVLAADQATRWLVTRLLPELEGTYRSTEGLSANPDALRAYLRGEHAFYRDLPEDAERHYTAALELDSTFALARWRLVNAWRWLPGRTPDLGPHLARLAAAGPGRLGPLDSLLLRARMQPAIGARLDAYRAAAESFEDDAFPRMLWGEELFHRGPLAGLPFDSAGALLEQATVLDSLFAPALDLLAWFYIRTGRRAEARRSLDRLHAVSAGPARARPTFADWLEHAFNERFDRAAALAGRTSLLAGANPAQQLAFAVRIPFAFELPDVLEELGTMAIAHPLARLQASGHYAIALANAARGRGPSALAQLDSATEHAGTPAAELHAAEWRVIPAALGIQLFDSAAGDEGRATLERLARVPATATRARWALALDAAARRDTARAAVLRSELARLAHDSAAPRLLGILEAQALAARRDFAGAIALSEASLVWDAQQAHGDPFARAVLHWLRADWFEQTGDAAALERELRWAENLDISGWPGGEPQAAEIDWMLSVHASYRRAQSALANNDPETGCRQLARVVEFRARAEGEAAGMAAAARQHREERCSR